MPLNAKGEEIKEHMEEEYGKKKGDSVFFASENSGKIEGVKEHEAKDAGERARKVSSK